MTVAVVPHLYNNGWARDLNRYLQGQEGFVIPIPYRHDHYNASRQAYHRWVAAALPEMRREGFDSILYVNLLDDYTLDFEHAGGVRRYFGLLQGLPGHDPRFLGYERAVCEGAAAAFVATPQMAAELPWDTVPIGLPIFAGRRTREAGEVPGDIIWNHRLVAGKGWRKLASLPGHIRDRITVLTPDNPSSRVNLPRVRKLVPRVYVGLDREAYFQELDRGVYALSTSTEESFGYSVAEAVVRGLLCFVPDLPWASMYPDHWRYNSPDDLVDRILFYDENPETRQEEVAEMQEVLAYHSPEKWLGRLRQHMAAAT